MLEPHDFVIRILVALVLGLLIGIERQIGQHPACGRSPVCSDLFRGLQHVIVNIQCGSHISG